MENLDKNLIREMTLWRRQLHSQPETGFEVHQTAELVAKLLTSFGLEVHTGIGQTGIVAVLTNGESNLAIGLRADMDALQIQEHNTFDHRSKYDGKMHACGHDGHSSMLLGAAKHLSENRNFNGTIYFIFQPNEEHGLGAQAMIDDGLFERFPMQSIFGIHNMPGMEAGRLSMRSGPVMASEDNFVITIKGRGGHASQPHHHIDPIVIGAEIIMALQTIVSRTISPEQQAVVSVTEIDTDGAVNVIPSNVIIKGDCRCFGDEVRGQIETQMGQLVKGICRAHGAQHEYEYIRLFHSTINDEEQTIAAYNAAVEAVGEGNVEKNCKPLTISEDFSSMLRVKAGCYIFIGNGIDSVGGCMLHNPNYDFNDNISATGVRYWSTLVEQKLSLNK
jgi:hippurate hydrolase|tara:strand:- start:199 stop:1368 length:1170 start_codon:yes stop_codon:yes gene_type:complete